MGSWALAQNNAEGALLSILYESAACKQRIGIFEEEGD
jgi:hypothetical protein